MTAPMLMTDCPTPETLAEFVDGTLDDLTRRKVTAHIADCGDCREHVNLAADFKAAENVTRFPTGWIATAAALATAAVLAIFALRPDFVYGPDINDVRAAGQSLKTRPGLGRQAGFAYQGEPSTPRGILSGHDDDSDNPIDDEEIARAKLLEIAANLREKKSSDLHVLGVAELLVASDAKELDAAVQKLQTAYDNAAGDERNAIAIDLASALIASSRFGDDRKRQASLERALDLSNDRSNADAMWNRAAALEALGQDKQALQAFAVYRQLDPNSEWTKEARTRENRIREFMRDTAPAPKR